MKPVYRTHYGTEADGFFCEVDKNGRPLEALNPEEPDPDRAREERMSLKD